METIDSLKPEDEVTITIWGPDGSCLYKSTNTGYHKIETAIKQTLVDAKIEIDPKDCVFEVTNLTKDVSHRYRLNAHGNLKLII